MPTATSFSVFLTAAVMLALSPGPGLFYVLTRSLKGGRRDGVASSFGTAIGGFVHVVAAAFGISAILATSALAFSVVKYLGAAYLVYLGIRTLLSHDDLDLDATVTPAHTRQAFYQGITTELLNPKTALFFLALLPQFINPQGMVVVQFLVLGSISIALNTSGALTVALLAGPIGRRLQASVRFRRRQRLATGSALIGLGAFVAVTGKQ